MNHANTPSSVQTPNPLAVPVKLDDATFLAVAKSIKKNHGDMVADGLGDISWLDAENSTKLLMLALDEEARDCLPLLLSVADPQGLEALLRSAPPARRSVVFRSAVDHGLASVMPCMLPLATAGLLTAEDLAWGLEESLSRSAHDMRAVAIAILLAQHGSPAPEQWGRIAACAIFSQDTSALRFVANSVDLLAWRLTAELAESAGLPKGSNLLSLSAVAGSPGQIEWLLDMGFDPKLPDASEHTPLMRAAHTDRPGNVRALLPVSDIEAADARGHTALALAALGSGTTTRLLLAAGANPNRKDFQGKTPLMRAAQSHNAENVKILASASDCSICDADGLTAFDHALREKSWDALDALISALPPENVLAAVLRVAKKFVPESAERAARAQEATELRSQALEGQLAARGDSGSNNTSRAPRL